MGQLCSPDRMDGNSQVAPNTTPSRKRTKENKENLVQNGYQEESVASYSNGQTVEATRHITESQSNTYDPSQSVIDATDLLEDLSIERSTSEPSKQYDIVDGDDHNGSHSKYEDDTDRTEQQQRVSLSTPRESKHTHSNTSRGGLSTIQTELGIDDATDKKLKKKSSGFQIVVTPADKTTLDNGGYSPIPNGARKQTDGNENDDSGNNKESEEDEEDLILKKRKQKIDSTLGGAISWKKVADFSALLPRDVKLKLWNGVFKTDSDYSQPEQKRISKVLRTFCMLSLTREYKKSNGTVPNEIKQQLPGAVKEPSKFIALFLKRDEKFIDQALLTIYNTLCDKFKTNDESKKAKYAKKAKMTQDNYSELIREDIKQEFNEDDFLKTAFLQYMLYAYQIKLDTDNARNNKGDHHQYR
eukprot:CAMPEP_0201579248 /NCGR_PEP_ID=MMETSP0190_2-20130828/26679_1 /ASSEMBLY_ACC=CAM_ASM_000263 /TAXON_ID=37353 /ORGANISM="Rosalina sp." /LENGTH=413 /DNA_ID=CAMNT_0048013433 /DNA_START=23 /DNA_END=1264 /DNA_ORIENTATION=-